MYEQQAQQAADGGAGFDPGNAGADVSQDGGPAPDNVVDADFEVVNDEKTGGDKAEE
jgi:hypothetical protein